MVYHIFSSNDELLISQGCQILEKTNVLTMFWQSSGLQARKSIWQCLGPTFDHPDYSKWLKGSSRLDKRHPQALRRLPPRYWKSVEGSLGSHSWPSEHVELPSGTLKQAKKSYFQDSQGFPSINFWQPGLCSDFYVKNKECSTQNLRPPYKILKAAFVRHKIPDYNPQSWRLCWEHTMSVRSIHNLSTPHKVPKSVPV